MRNNLHKSMIPATVQPIFNKRKVLNIYFDLVISRLYDNIDVHI